jgi:hypothetical protein
MAGLMRAIVVKGVGGLGNRILGLLGAVVYARRTGRRLIVDWRDSMYADDGENAFFTLFESKIAEPPPAMWPEHATVAPSPWRGRLDASFSAMLDADRTFREQRESLSIDLRLHHQEDIVVAVENLFAFERASLRTTCRETLAFSAKVRAAADGFAQAAFHSPTVGIHVRATDNQIHRTKRTNLSGYPAAIDRTLAELSRAALFIATDSARVLDDLSRRYPAAAHLEKRFPRIADRPLHRSTEEPDGRLQIGLEAATELALLGRCDAMVYSRNSTFALVAALLADRELRLVDVERSLWIPSALWSHVWNSRVVHRLRRLIS